MKQRLFVVAGVSFVAATAIAFVGAYAPAGNRGAWYVAAHLLAAAAMLLAFAVGDVARVFARLSSTSWMMLLGVLCRLALIPAPPYTTHDVTRYLLDGAMVLAGLDPYRVAPNDPLAASLHALWPSALEHAKYTTIYPPAALWAFASCARFGPTHAWLVWKALVGVASVTTLALARRVVRGRALALVAFSPLLLLEGGIGAHLDVLCAMTVMLAVLERTPLMQGAWIGIGVLLKLTPIMLLAPLLAYTWSAARRGAHALVPRGSSAAPGHYVAVAALVGALVVVVAGYGVATALGYEAVGSLVTFFGKWSFGSPWIFIDAPREMVLRIALAVTAIAVAAASYLAFSQRLAAGLLLAACAPFIASPIVFPWYLCTVAVVLGIEPSWPALAWMTVLPLTYEVIDRFDVDGTWAPARWPIVVTCVAVAVGILVERCGPYFLRRAQARLRARPG